MLSSNVHGFYNYRIILTTPKPEVDPCRLQMYVKCYKTRRQ